MSECVDCGAPLDRFWAQDWLSCQKCRSRSTLVTDRVPHLYRDSESAARYWDDVAAGARGQVKKERNKNACEPTNDPDSHPRD